MIVRLHYRRYSLPFRNPVRTAHGPWTTRDGLLIRLEHEDGRVGFGEAAPITDFGTESIDEAEAACRALGEMIDENKLAGLPSRLGCLRHALMCARDGIEERATTGERTGGLENNPFRAVAALLPAGKAALAQVPPKAEFGFRIFKWKVGVADLADELAILDDVCAVLPSGAKLRLDANGAWDRRKAERWFERCADRPVEFVEQPCFAPAAWGDSAVRRTDDLLLGLAGDYPTKIALDESLVGEGDIERWLAAGWPGVFVVKPSLIGDVPRAMARLAKARADVVFSSALETAVGARNALRVAFDWRGEPRALGFGVWPLFADSRFDGPFAAPALRREDVERIDVAGVWNALS